MNPIPAAAALRRKLGLVVLSCVGLWVCALLSCALFPFSSQPPNLRTEPQSNLLELIHSLAALDPYKSDRIWRRDTRNTVQYLLQAVTAAAAAPTNSRDLHRDVTASARLRTVLQGASDDQPSQLCHWLKDDIPAAAISPQQSVLLAGLLTNNEALMPHYILQLLQFVVAKPVDKLFVSIYESGSTDKTGKTAAFPTSHMSPLWMLHDRMSFAEKGSFQHQHMP